MNLFFKKISKMCFSAVRICNMYGYLFDFEFFKTKKTAVTYAIELSVNLKLNLKNHSDIRDRVERQFVHALVPQVLQKS